MRLNKENLLKALEIMAGEADLLVPKNTESGTKFAPWHHGDGLPALDLVNTLFPPKDALFPQTEKMYRFSSGAGKASVTEEVSHTQQIVFGIRPCDVYSIGCMDKVFLTKGYVDAFYQRKREGLTIVSIGCTKAAETCFCSSMGLDCAAAPLADVMLLPTDGGWNVTAQTEKGDRLLKKLAPVLDEGEDAPLPKAECAISFDFEGVPEKLLGMFEDPMWDEIYRPCLGCGTCTYLCPTCYCFDINYEKCGSEGTQFRCWDSCMFSEYTRMAGGHNPRPSKKERVRNRYMHKLAYFNERYGQNLCVGCGRCLEKCPVGMDITRVIAMVKEGNANG